MVRKLTIAIALVMIAGTAKADDIIGNWKTKSGGTAAISSCGQQFCITLKGGPYNGRQIGTFKANGNGSYSGKITDPDNDKTYTGKATLSGNTLKMSGCVLGVLCRGENWSRL